MRSGRDIDSICFKLKSFNRRDSHSLPLSLVKLLGMNEILKKKVSPPFEANPCTHLLNVSHYLLFTPCPLKGVLAL
jgi:hypothetical protein